MEETAAIRRIGLAFEKVQPTFPEGYRLRLPRFQPKRRHSAEVPDDVASTTELAFESVRLAFFPL